MPHRFDECLEFVLEREGGYSNHPADRGGATKQGITQRTYWEYLARKGRQPVDIKDIPFEDVREIYLRQYWQAGKCDKLEPTLDLIHFDACVNHGVGLAGKMLQSALNVRVIDGIIGPITRAAAAEANPLDATLQYAKRRLERYIVISKIDSSQRVFRLGWAHRLGEVLRAL